MTVTDFSENYHLYENMAVWEIKSIEDFFKAHENLYEIFEKEHEIKGEWFGGYSRNNKIFRRVIEKETGDLLCEEKMAENHALMMYDPLLENTKEGH